MNKKFIKVLAGLGFAHLALLSATAFSQEKTINQLDEVVVTASRSPRKQSETGKVVRVISAAQLAQSQGRTLPELLNNVAGLNMGGFGNHPSEIKALYLRGASAGNTLILIDGIAVNDASNISGEYDISAIAIEQIERIEILKGGNSTLYGSDAVAGVINIITKKGEGSLKAHVLATGGSYGTYKQVLGLNGSLGSTRIGFNASNLNVNGFSTARPASNQENYEKDGFKQRSIGLNVQQAISLKFKLNANVQANQNLADLDNGAFDDNADYTYNKTALLVGLGGQFIAGKAVYNFNLSQNNVDNRFLNSGSPETTRGDITNLEANVSYPLAPFVDLIGGLNYKRSSTDQVSPWGALTADNNIKSVYSSLFFKLGEQFRTELGGRLNEHNVYGNNLTYTFNPSYLIANRYKLFVNLSSAFKVPSLYQLFSEYGNLNLKPESTNTFEAGADMELVPSKLRLNLAYFNRNIKDVIDFGLVGQDFRYVNKNQQKDKGFELELNYKPSAKITVDAFYAYVTGKQIQGSESINNLIRRPKHSLGLNLQASLSKQFTAAVSYKWVAERIDQYYDTTKNESVSVDLKPFGFVDAYLQYRPKSNWTLFADVKNLLDTDFIDRAGYTTKGINFNAGFKFDIR